MRFLVFEDLQDYGNIYDITNPAFTQGATLKAIAIIIIIGISLFFVYEGKDMLDNQSDGKFD